MMFWRRKPAVAVEPKQEDSARKVEEEAYRVDRYTWHPPLKGPYMWTCWRLAEEDGYVVARVTLASTGSWKAKIVGRPKRREYATVEAAKVYVETTLIRTPSVSELSFLVEKDREK